MKKFILKVLIFFACVVVMDFVFGLFFSFLRAHAKGGSTANCEYIANRATDDIIILGSSRATHHYVPQIIEDSLGMSCYNCGEEGNGIVLAYGRYRQLTSRYKPKLIVYEVTPGYDYSNQEPDEKYIGYLRPYYQQSAIKEIVNDFGDDWEKLKMTSNMYQNTSKLLPNVVDNVIYRDNNKGFEPLSGVKMSPMKEQPKWMGENLDPHKLSYIERLMTDAKADGILICFVVSPRCELGDSMEMYEPVMQLCNKHSIPFLNYKNYPGISDQPYLFQDDSHLNKEGAELYTRVFINEIIKISGNNGRNK